jgi:hypothetical protein
MRINSRSLRTSSRKRIRITGKAQIGATRHQPSSDSIARIAGERKVAAGQILLHVLGVGGAGERQDPDRLREAEHHLSPRGLATCGDPGDQRVPQDLRVGGEQREALVDDLSIPGRTLEHRGPSRGRAKQRF